jgi:hypothetical protein
VAGSRSRNRQQSWTGWRDWSRGDLGGGGLLRPLEEHSFLELRDVGDRAEEMLGGGLPGFAGGRQIPPHGVDEERAAVNGVGQMARA